VHDQGTIPLAERRYTKEQFKDWADVVEQIRAHRADDHHLVTVEAVHTRSPIAGVHLAIHDPLLYDEPICSSFSADDTQLAPRDAAADCIVCLALMREAHGIDVTEPPTLPPLGRDVWKLKALNVRDGEWRTKRVGGEECLSQMLADMLRWKAEGQQVRLEWSELN
jgi:hypothetical protein